MGTRKSRRVFTKELKETILSLYDSGQKVSVLSKDYDIDSGTIYRWNKERKEDRPSFTGIGVSRLTEEQKELKALRKQLEDMTEERDILKKVVRIFSVSDRKNTTL